MHRISLVAMVLTLVGGAMTAHAQAAGLLNPADMKFLQEIATAVIDESRVAQGETVAGHGPNITGGTVIRPGGRNCYPAFWIRDYAMSLESGLITADEQRHMLMLTASHQQDEMWNLPSGSIVPPGSITDHISFGNKPIFFAGTIDDYDGQGGPRWGKLPCLDDAFFFIHMAAHYVETTGDTAILAQDVNGKPLFQRLEEAYAMPPCREDTGLVYSIETERGVSFGFVDTVTHTGDLLFCSLLKCRAARDLAELARQAGDGAKSAKYYTKRGRLMGAICDTFTTPSGLLKASTGKSAQLDVWGTAFAVYTDAITGQLARDASEALAQAARDGRVAWKGNIRHVPTNGDFSDATMWEGCLAPKNRYQNGAYWNTPTGWVCYAVAKADRDAAARIAAAFVQELREGDFRKGPKFGSPWECIHPDGEHRQNPVYMTSVTCPLAAFRRMAEEKQ
ncbi:MAG: hypothetical protein GY851_20560 [bacterium]|nr:hypothetical protein [bacterium]